MKGQSIISPNAKQLGSNHGRAQAGALRQSTIARLKADGVKIPAHATTAQLVSLVAQQMSEAPGPDQIEFLARYVRRPVDGAAASRSLDALHARPYEPSAQARFVWAQVEARRIDRR